MRTVALLLVGSLAALAAAPGRLAAQLDFTPPPANVPSEETMKLIAEKATRLGQLIGALRKQGLRDPLLADVEIYHQAAEAIVQHREFFDKDSGTATLTVLDRGLLRARLLAQGEAPWTGAVGQAVARGYRSRIDGSVQPFAVTYPRDYGKGANRKWRVDVELHGRGATLTEVRFLNAHSGEKAAPADQNFVRLEVYGRGNNAYRYAGETDVFEALNACIKAEELVGRGRLIDPNRVVLRGFSMGGAGTWHLGLHWPDRWCVMGPGAGFTTTHGYAPKLPNPLPPYQEPCLHIYDAVDYASNAFDIPVVAYSGANDPQKQAADNIEEALKKLGIPMTHIVAPELKHQFPPEWFKKVNQIYTKYAEKGRPDYPDDIKFTTYTLKYPGCFWATILGLERHYDKAEVQAKRTDAGYTIKTRNVRALHLTMPEGMNQPQEIDIDEQKLTARPGADLVGSYHVYLQRRDGKWQPVLPQRLIVEQARRPQKVHNLQGPIDDAFMEPFLCVRGTGRPWHEATQTHTDARLKRFALEWSKYWRGQLPVKDDTDVTAEDIASRHLILFGDPSSNSLLAQALDGLPLQWTKDEIQFAGRKVGAADHVPVLIYPSPLNPQRYVVLNSGHTFPTAAYTQTNAMLFPRLGDYALVRVAPQANDALATDVVEAGLFNEYWEIEQ
jgi:predicted esterase